MIHPKAENCKFPLCQKGNNNFGRSLTASNIFHQQFDIIFFYADEACEAIHLV